MDESIRFKINRKKVIEALVFLAERQPRIDVFHVCKVLFYADMSHMQKYGRPILGDQYMAMDDGPVPTFALDIAKRRKNFVAPHWIEEADRRLAIDDSDGYVRLMAKDSFDPSLFSRTDIRCLTEALDAFGRMPFRALSDRVHKESAWKKHYVEGTSTPIPFEDMLPDRMPNREKIIEQLREHSGITEL